MLLQIQSNEHLWLYPEAMALVTMGAAAAVVGAAWIRRSSILLAVYPTRIVYSTVILAATERSISLSRIIGVNTFRSLNDRSLGIGLVQIESRECRVLG
jgi:hypothetical protein